MKFILRSLLVACIAQVVVGLPACAADAGKSEACENCVEGNGTVRHSDVEGGFWYIEGDDGTNYDPNGIPKELATDGQRVHFVLQLMPERMGFHMLGKIVKIVKIEKLDAADDARNQ